ncbi:MAG: Na/Pi cotransporter family protein [Chloroflexota bacterium]|nr:Na/Pi cotransporter family protein [Chloroflexota bacterium]MDE3193057.1 Na/Pi cotransporter family protein [Chloroflexota bacterium]
MDQGNTVLVSLLGGAALLLYGVRLVGEGLQRAAGGHLRHILQSLSGNRVTALFVGAGVTAVLQSSSATTVMLVGFASAGLLSLRQTIGVILGADIGTTLTVQLLAFDLLGLSPLIVFLGWLLFAATKGPLSYVGRAVLGFGLLFLGIRVISEGTAPLKQSPLFSEVISALVGQEVVLIVAAALLTALVASSAAVIGIAISLSASGIMPLEGAIPIILGANVGTAASALVASVGTNVEARRVAVAHASFKVLGALLFLPFLEPFARFAAGTAPDIARQIANAHTIFNVVLSILFLPLAGIAADVITRLIPETRRTERGAIYLNVQTLDTPAVALGQALRETLRMGDLVVLSLKETLRVFERDDEPLLRQIHLRDDDIDRLEEDIKAFLTKLREQSLTEEQAERETALLFVVVDLEAVGDVIDKQLMELAEKKVTGHHRFSERGLAEVADLHAKVVENLELALGALAAADASVAEKVLRHKSVISELERRYRSTHMQRLRDGLKESIDTSSIHLDVLLALRQVNSFATAIAYAVLGKHLPAAANGAEHAAS